MTELDGISAFRADVASPAPGVRRAARMRLQAAIRAAAAGGDRSNAYALAKPRFVRRRLAAIGGLAAAVAAAGLAFGNLWAGGPSVLERAQAALDPAGRILHVIARVESAEGVVRSESWVLADGSRGRTISLSSDPLADCIAQPTQLRCWDEERHVIDVYRYNPEAIAKGAELADVPQVRMDRPESIGPALASGYARLLGESVVSGRHVYEVLLAVPRIGADGSMTPLFIDGMSSTLYVDRDTLYPVAQRFPDARSTTYYETFEFLADNAMNRARLRLPAPAGTKINLHPIGEGPQG